MFEQILSVKNIFKTTHKAIQNDKLIVTHI